MISKNKKKVFAAKMAQFSSDFQVISKNKNKKKNLRSEMAQFSPDFQVILKKKKKRKKKVLRSSPFWWALWSPVGPLMGPFKSIGSLNLMGSLIGP